MSLVKQTVDHRTCVCQQVACFSQTAAAKHLTHFAPALGAKCAQHSAYLKAKGVCTLQRAAMLRTVQTRSLVGANELASAVIYQQRSWQLLCW